MADDKNRNQTAGESINNPDSQTPEEVAGEQNIAAPHPDTAAYVLQPTPREDLDPAMGSIPEDRFMQQVRKGSEEDSGSGVEAHPNINRPASAEDEGSE